MNDTITSTYDSSSRTVELDANTPWDTTQENAGCEIQSVYVAVCDWSSGHPLDSILYYGGAGGDSIGANQAGLPVVVTPFILGGDGSDSDLTGGNLTEDVVIDGPDAGSDTLYGYGNVDSVYQGAGTDHIYGGSGDDVMYSTGICEGNIIDGGDSTDRDNITWAALPLYNGSNSLGVYANINPGPYFMAAGNTGSWGIPTCTSGTVDSLDGVENLEGSNGRDFLFGNSESNALLGRAGVDNIWGGDGADYLHTFSDDYDVTIDCGAGGDTLARDFNADDFASRTDGRDSTLSNCNGTGDTRSGKDPEYQYSVERVEIGNSNGRSDYSTPRSFYRLGERFGTNAYASDGVGTDVTGSFVGSPTLGVAGAFPNSEDTAIRLDGNDNLLLGADVDPAKSNGENFSFEIWVKFLTAPPTAGQYHFILSKYTNPVSSGFLFYRNDTGNLVFSTKRTDSSTSVQVTAPSPTDTSKWHQFVGTLSGSTISLWVDGTQYQSTGNVFPNVANSGSMLVGKSPITGAGWPRT